MAREVNNVEIAEAPAFRQRFVACIARVVMSPALRAEITRAVNGVKMPLYQCMQTTTSARWEGFKQKALRACAAILDGQADRERIYKDLIKVIGVK